MDWSSICDKVDPNACIPCIPCIPELTQGYVLQPTPDPFDRLKGIGNLKPVTVVDESSALEAKEYLQQHANYAELFTVINRAFSMSTIQEQHKILKAFIVAGAHIETLLQKDSLPLSIVVISNAPSKVVYGEARGGEGGYGVWTLGGEESCLKFVENMKAVDKLLVNICKIETMKMDQLKQVGKLVGLPGVYKLKKSELILALQTI